ncbi:hypothetical protein [Haloarchaeobius litoreus]|uniref:Halobacterial output domain-containing protein n=1 Tax=Haloarchaeobius litoreus TaxID=755306 RepID=A0ABD6DQT7_9EURY|nr:hypothetical protein [Haloarchaeobius litoreus]
MVERSREPRRSNEPTEEEQYRSVSITEASDGFVVDVDVDWQESPEDADVNDADTGIDSTDRTPSGATDTTADQASETAQDADPLPNELLVDGSDTQGDATYTLSVSGEIRADCDASSDAEAVEQPAPPTEGRVVGIVNDGIHVYRYSGRLEAVSVDGNVDLRLGGRSR